MTKKVITIAPSKTLIKALVMMKYYSTRHLPLYNKFSKYLHGVISYKNFTLKIME